MLDVQRAEANQKTHIANPNQRTYTVDLLLSAVRLIVWLLLSSGVVLSNKWLLDPMRFPFPVSLTCSHMTACVVTGAIAFQSGLAVKPKLSWRCWAKFCLPVGALSASALLFGNTAFLYMTVSFMQMLKANLPVIVFVVGCVIATEAFTWSSFGIVLTIAAGVAMASHGEVDFSVFGVVCMFSGMICEAIRLTMVQLLLQREDLNMNVMSSLYYIMPVALACLLPVACVSEATDLLANKWVTYRRFLFLVANAAGAVALNLSSYIVVGAMSALTMKLAAIMKDIGLVAISCLLFGDTLSFLGIAGYSIAVLGVCAYNYNRLQLLRQVPVGRKLASKENCQVCDTPQHVKAIHGDWRCASIDKSAVFLNTR